MKQYSRMIIMLVSALAIGGLVTALYGRASSAWFNRYTVFSVLLFVSYVFGAEISENKTQAFVTTLFTFAAPSIMLIAIIDSKYIFGYTKNNLFSRALMFGGVVCLACFLSRHAEPLRSALGRCFVPAFLLAEAANRLIYYKQSAGSWFSLSANDCRLVVFFAALGLVLFFYTNRKALAKGDPYLALVIWGLVMAGAIFAGRKLSMPHIPILF
ncbi:MAG: hypothetical protein IKO44_03390 [Ruminococcus sp.]|nr:hypothetical protein [Ruminococcus sp.]